MKLHSHIAAILTIASFAAGAGQTLTLLALAAFSAFAICGAFATTDTYARIGKDVSIYPELMKRAMNSALNDLSQNVPGL